MKSAFFVVVVSGFKIQVPHLAQLRVEVRLDIDVLLAFLGIIIGVLLDEFLVEFDLFLFHLDAVEELAPGYAVEI